MSKVNIREDINRLCKILYLEVEETSENFFRVGKTVEDFSMGFHTSTYMCLITGTGRSVLSYLRSKAGECTSFVEDRSEEKPSVTLAEAQWIADILHLPSNRVDDVRDAVTVVMDAREK